MLENLKNCLKTNEILKEMLYAMPVYGLLCQVTIVWFVQDKTAYSLGLWLGILIAACMALHMSWGLEYALDFDGDTAQKIMTKHNIIRYIAVVIVLGLIMVSGFINPLSAFLGLMGLKVSAYLQPFTHKIIRR